LLNFSKICKLFEDEPGAVAKPYTLIGEKFTVPIIGSKDLKYYASLKPRINSRRIKAGTIMPDEINWPILCSDMLSSRKHLYMIINILGFEHNQYRSTDGLLLNIYTQ